MRPAKSKVKDSFVRLEPARKYDHAIVKESSDGFLTYSFRRLIKIEMDYGIPNEEEAIEYLEYNLLGTSQYGEGLFAIDYKRK